MMNTDAKGRAMDAVLVEDLVSLNLAGARQWAFFSGMVQNQEVKLLLTTAAQFEERVVTDLKELIPRLTQ